MLRYVVGYFAGAVVTNVVLNNIHGETERNKQANAITSIGWPIVVPIGVLGFSIYNMAEIVGNITYKKD